MSAAARTRREGGDRTGGGQRLTTAFREGCPSGGSQPRLAHLLTPRCPLPASLGHWLCDRRISISVKSPQTMPPLCGEMKSPALGGGARLKSPKGGAARIRGGGCVDMKAGEKCRAACACLRGDPRPGVQDGLGGSQPPGNPSALYSPRPLPPPNPGATEPAPQALSSHNRPRAGCRASARCFVLRAWNPRPAVLSARRGAPLRRPGCFHGDAPARGFQGQRGRQSITPSVVMRFPLQPSGLFRKGTRTPACALGRRDPVSGT